MKVPWTCGESGEWDQVENKFQRQRNNEGVKHHRAIAHETVQR